ncbi:hypothetical protein MJM45_27315, partial [Salmonella enterica subsp. enterica serovar Kentucky]|nr:hypothetical protein [Salmonella enterica subsp. enterica serovar Kentucky]
DVCEAGDRYLDEIFERIQTELNKRGFQIFDLNEGSDTYNVVVHYPSGAGVRRYQ